MLQQQPGAGRQVFWRGGDDAANIVQPVGATHEELVEPAGELHEVAVGQVRLEVPGARPVLVEEERAGVVDGDVQALPFEDASFDLVVMMHALTYAAKPQQAVSEAARVLRPGGAFLVYQFTAAARDFMAKHFRHIDAGFELLNVLPCKLFWGWKE